MMATTQMSVQDALWLTMDRPNNLMVVDSAIVLAGTPTLEEVKAAFITGTERFPVFKRKAARRGASWFWVDDAKFDIDRHFLPMSLDGPADMAALQRFAAEQRAMPLNRNRPLWTAFLVSPLTLDDGTVGSAVVTRFHHAIADGVRLTQVLLGMCDTGTESAVPAVARNGTGGGPFASVQSAVAGTTEAARVSAAAVQTAAGSAARAAGGLAASVGSAASSAVGNAVSDPLGTLAAVPSALAAAPGRALSAVTGMSRAGRRRVDIGVEIARHPDRMVDALEALGVTDHRSLNDMNSVTKLLLTDSGNTIWSGRPGRRKAVAWSPAISLPEVKRIGHAQGGTVNDVLLAAIAGALRNYLAEHGAQVDEVVWMVPVNLKPFEENLPEDLGNYFALVMLPMSLRAATCVERLQEMHHRMLRIKHSDEAVITFGLQRTMSMSPGRVATFMTNFFANKSVGVLTNVPGPSGEMTFAGIPVRQVVGFAPCSGDQPMTATIFSYNNTVTVGFASDAKLVPDPERIVALVVDEVAAMGRLAEPARGPGR